MEINSILYNNTLQQNDLRVALLNMDFDNNVSNQMANINKLSSIAALPPCTSVFVPYSKTMQDYTISMHKLCDIVISNAKLGIGYFCDKELSYLLEQNLSNQKNMDVFLHLLSDEYIEKIFIFILGYAKKVFFDDFSLKLLEDTMFCYTQKRYTICGNVLTDVILQLWESSKENQMLLVNNNDVVVNDYQIVLSKIDDLPTNLAYGYIMFYSINFVLEYLFYDKKDNKLSPKNKNTPFNKHDCLRLFLLLGELLNFVYFLDEECSSAVSL